MTTFGDMNSLLLTFFIAMLTTAEIDGRKASGLSATAETPASVKGYAISPVAYRDPEPSEYLVRVRFHAAGGAPVEKGIGVNHPATFAGISFCLVGLDTDRYGNPYAGLQMTREPGEPVFWAGALLFALTLTLGLAVELGLGVAWFRMKTPVNKAWVFVGLLLVPAFTGQLFVWLRTRKGKDENPS